MSGETAWTDRPEGGGFFAIWAIITLAKRLGRRAVRPLLLPITAYFVMLRGAERRGSLAYLKRVLPRTPTWMDAARHIHTFSSTILDRVFLLSGPIDRFDVQVQGLEALHHALDQRRGVLLFGSHHGSFEVLRVLAQRRPEYSIRIVMDKGQNGTLTRLLGALNPTLAANIIDAGQDGPSVVMAIQQATAEGAMVALLVDRIRPGEPGLPAQFLGGTARFPTSPWLIASALKVPVVLGFGLYRGGARYDLHFELFDEEVSIPRSHRAAALASLIQRYAARLETFVQSAPYNWFNFYDFWSHDDATPPPPAPHHHSTAAGGEPSNPCG